MSESTPVRFMFTDQEGARIRAAADLAGVSLGGFVRHSIHQLAKSEAWSVADGEKPLRHRVSEPGIKRRRGTTVRLSRSELNRARALSVAWGLSMREMLLECVFRVIAQGSWDDKGRRIAPTRESLRVGIHSEGVSPYRRKA